MVTVSHDVYGYAASLVHPNHPVAVRKAQRAYSDTYGMRIPGGCPSRQPFLRLDDDVWWLATDRLREGGDFAPWARLRRQSR
jgi:hypothetical protein